MKCNYGPHLMHLGMVCQNVSYNDGSVECLFIHQTKHALFKGQFFSNRTCAQSLQIFECAEKQHKYPKYCILSALKNEYSLGTRLFFKTGTAIIKNAT